MCEWEATKLQEIAVINPAERLAKGIKAKKVAMEFLQPFTKKISTYAIEKYKGGVKFRNGDTLVARITPSLENGKTSFVDLLEDDEIGFGSTEFIVLRKIEGISDKNFLFYLACSPEFRDAAIASMTGSSGRQRVQTDVVKQHEFLLPPLPEQRAIASVLSSLDDKIDLLHRQNKTLEAMAETLFRQWFVEEADEGWGEGTLGDYINVKHGYAFKGKFITTEKNNQILVTPGNFKIGGGFKFGKMKYFIGSDYPKDYIFSSNDLIVTMTDLSKEGDTLGYSALIPEHNQDEVLYLHNQRVGRVEFKKYISKYLFYYLMKTDDYQWFILGGASGTSVRHTSPTSICSYTFQVPPMKRIKEFDAVVSGLISKVHQNQIQIHTLEKLRDTLLPKVMSGEVMVEFKKHMEEYESDSHV